MSIKLALAVLVSVLHLLSAILLNKEFTSRNIDRNVSIGEYPQRMTSTPAIYLPREVMLIQLGIKNSLIWPTLLDGVFSKLLTTKY